MTEKVKRELFELQLSQIRKSLDGVVDHVQLARVVSLHCSRSGYGLRPAVSDAATERLYGNLHPLLDEVSSRYGRLVTA